MSQENVEIVWRFFAAIGRGDEGETALGTMQRLTTEDVVYVEDPSWPGSDTYRGKEAVSECWSKYDELMGGAVSSSVLSVRDAGERLVSVVQVSGHTRDSGVPFHHTWGYICRVREGRVSYFRAYLHPNDALDAAGLSE
jgi:ketosteroid isomerase-like protein